MCTASVQAYDVLGRSPRRDLLAVADLAARLCGVPMATVNLFTETEQHQVAAVGFDASVCRREDSMCTATMQEQGTVIVSDASADDRFRNNPFVNGELGHVRFYAAHRLVSHEGVVVGTLCVFDTVPRPVVVPQLEALEVLAERVVDVLELSRRTRELSISLAHVEAIRVELAESNERLASFAGQVSHDLKTPLTAVAMSLSLARAQILDGEPPIDSVWLLDRAISGTGRMAALIDEILGFAQLGGSLTPADVDLLPVVSDVLADLNGELDGVSMVIGALPVVRGDAVQLRAVLQNFVSNAVKFRHEGRRPVIEIGARRVGGAWRIEVSDNGRGIAAEQATGIFEPLMQIDDSVSGSGIGLATCRRIIEAHDGRIGFDTVSEGGSVFWFDLPT